MADKKISELDLALQINNDAVIPFSQDNGGEPTSFKGLITQIGSKIAEDMTFSNLQTTSKTLVGAINELLSLGNPIILGTTAPSSSVGKDGNLYIQYTIGTGGADDTVDDIFIKINGAWCEIQTGGAGGHTIVDNSGTDLAQRTNLQFNGAYSEDNSADDTTEVFVVRSMTRAQFENLSAAEKVGLINITDESLNATELPISASDSTNTKDYIDSGLSTVESNAFPNYWSLFADQNTSNTIKTIDVVSGRKISDFTLLFAIVIRGNGERASSIIPTGKFTTGTWVSLTEVDSANTQRWYEIKYVDDTHITVQCSPNAEGSEVHIYGIGTTATYS